MTCKTNDIPGQKRDSIFVPIGEILEPLDEFVSLRLVTLGTPMIIEII